MMNYHKLLPAAVSILSTVLLFGFAKDAMAETLVTRNFQVDISRNCAEGNVTCNNVSYYGFNRWTGESIALVGRTMHSPCADGVTPCAFRGYIFRNGNYRYIVNANGVLEVREGNRRLLREQGTWQY